MEEDTENKFKKSKKRELEKRCPRCWTILSIFEEEEGETSMWCHNCGTRYRKPVERGDKSE